jgi:rubrerythrin
MPNVDMEAVGKDHVIEPEVRNATPQEEKRDRKESREDDSIPLEASRDIVKAAEKETGASSGESSTKKFNMCPFCGEELNLPKQPKFCPYCKEAFA